MQELEIAWIVGFTLLSKMGQLTRINLLYQAWAMIYIKGYIHCVHRCIFVTFGSNMTVANMAHRSQSRAETTAHWPSPSMSTRSQSYSSGVMGHLNSAPGRVPCWAPWPAARGAPTRILGENSVHKYWLATGFFTPLTSPNRTCCLSGTG